MATSTADLLANVCGFFDLGPPLRFSDAGGYANRNLILETGKGSYLAKILREHGPDALQSEALYLEEIAVTGFLSPTYLTGRDGSYVFAAADQLVAVMPFLDGAVPEQISSEQIESLGAALAQLHLIEPGALPSRKTWWGRDFLGDGLVRAKAHLGDKALAPLEKQIAALPDLEAKGLPRSIVHGDPWPGNALFDGRRLVALVDWEETTLGLPILDLAYLALHACLSGRDFEARRFDALIDSYQSVRELTSHERRCFEPAVRRVACTNYLWLLLKESPSQGEREAHWSSQWYENLRLECLTLA